MTIRRSLWRGGGEFNYNGLEFALTPTVTATTTILESGFNSQRNDKTEQMRSYAEETYF